jgi:hypothetical protein
VWWGELFSKFWLRIIKKMLRVYHLLLGIILLPVSIVGIQTMRPRLSPTVEEKPIPTTTTNYYNSPVKTPENTPPKVGNTWNRILGKTPLPEGWEVIPCEGNSPLLCVSSQGKLLGTVEVGVYSLADYPKFQQNLINAGILPDSQPDYHSPEYQNKLSTALQAWVADVNETILRDRQKTFNNTILFSAYPPQPASVGKLPGIRYGFVGIKPEGGVQELHISHVTFDGQDLYVMTTAFDPESVTGKFDELENLAIFQPYFAAIAANLNLPFKGIMQYQ